MAKIGGYVRNTLFRNVKFFQDRWKKYSDEEQSFQAHVMDNLGLFGGGNSKEAHMERVNWWNDNWKTVRYSLNKKRDNVAASLLRKFESKFFEMVLGLLLFCCAIQFLLKFPALYPPLS